MRCNWAQNDLEYAGFWQGFVTVGGQLTSVL
jgi:hypothetical protein